MPPNESETDAASEAAVTEYYGAADLTEQLLEAIESSGVDIDDLSREDIASFDEFHIRGREATREVAELGGIDEHARVLDVGCGIGGPARTLAAEFGCDVVGVEIVEEYRRAATLFTDRLGLAETVRFQHGNALDLPFEDDKFDVVWFEHVLSNIAAKHVALEEAGRVLSPGGTLTLYAICAGPGGEPVFPVPWAADASLSYLLSPEHLRQTVLDHGFQESAWRDVTESSLDSFREVVASMESRPAEAPPPLGPNLLMGADAPIKVKNVCRNLEEDRIAVVQGAFERTK